MFTVPFGGEEDAPPLPDFLCFMIKIGKGFQISFADYTIFKNCCQFKKKMDCLHTNLTLRNFAGAAVFDSVWLC